MEHLSDGQLLEALGGTPDPVAAAHLEGCAACRRVLGELREPWDRLGDWEVSPPQIDLRASVLAAARAAGGVRLWQTRSLLRVAAAVAIGLGGGLLLSRTTAGPGSPEAVTEALYLEVLALDSATGLTRPLLEAAEEP